MAAVILVSLIEIKGPGRGGLVVSAKASESLLRGSNPASTLSGIACRDPEEFSPGPPVPLELDSIGTVRTGSCAN